MQIQIAEMRRSLETDFAKVAKFGDQLSAMPDWATRRIYESRNGLTVTPFPSGMEIRSLRSIMSTVRRTTAPALPAVVDDPDDQKKKLGFMIEALRYL